MVHGLALRLDWHSSKRIYAKHIQDQPENIMLSFWQEHIDALIERNPMLQTFRDAEPDDTEIIVPAPHRRDIPTEALRAWQDSVKVNFNPAGTFFGMDEQDRRILRGHLDPWKVACPAIGFCPALNKTMTFTLSTKWLHPVDKDTRVYEPPTIMTDPMKRVVQGDTPLGFHYEETPPPSKNHGSLFAVFEEKWSPFGSVAGELPRTYETETDPEK